MEITDIVVNPDNLDKYSFSTQTVRMGCIQLSASMLDRKGFDDCLTAHMTLNTYLDSQLGDGDWGGKYANWLNEMGFEHQTDDGWWNLIAVTPENIQAFIRFWDCEDYQDQVNAALARYNRKKFKHNLNLVDDFIQVFG